MHLKSLFGAARQVSLALATFAASCSTFAAPVCNGDIYLSQSGTQENTFLLRNSGTPVNFVTQGQASHVYNALAFHPTNGLYGIVTFSTELLKIDETTGASTSLGPVSGLPTTIVGGTATANYNAATFGTDGVYYVKESNNNTALYAIDTSVSPAVATPITLSQAINISDMGWVGDRLYSYGDNGQLYSIEVPSGTVTLIGSPPAGTIPRFGSQFSGTNGLFGIDNNGTGFYKIDLTTGALTLISSAPGSSNNDGASCPTAEVLSIAPPKADLSISKDDNQSTFTPGTDVVYTIIASNAGPNDATGAKVSDALPAGITVASWTCAADTGSACTASGTGAINDAAVNLPAVTGRVTYTLTLTVPSDFTGNLVNTAKIAPPNGIVDPDTTNNSATDTDTAAPIADMQATSTTLPTTVEAGQTVTGTITCTNAGPSVAAAATCAIPGLPAGATTVCVPTSPTSTPLAVGAKMECTVSYVAPGSGPVKATITAGSSTPDSNPNNNTLPYEAVVTPVADMQATGTTLPSTVTAGQTVTGTITCTNAGPSAAADATCAIPGLPAGATTVCNPASPTATPLGANTSMTCNVSYTAPSSGTVTGTITAGSSTKDAVPTNNTKPYSATMTESADMQATGTTLPSTVTAGQTVTGTITCTNAGPSAAANATCAIPGLPAGATTVCTPTSPTSTPLAQGGKLVCEVSYVAPASGTVTATITAGSTTADSNPNNNTLPYTASQAVAPVPAPVPTLGQWALALMALLMAGFAALRMRKQ
ncbi:IPTL-CTERM sorting domain-containing protein [Comamonas sp. J-3]|uniref:IPTL-CTERM sorting domain-containing protein n=1 Tax=Comamonas trifloxystrobinivorans TaxID=3350256 RepID=UPI00372BEE5A